MPAGPPQLDPRINPRKITEAVAFVDACLQSYFATKATYYKEIIDTGKEPQGHSWANNQSTWVALRSISNMASRCYAKYFCSINLNNQRLIELRADKAPAPLIAAGNKWKQSLMQIFNECAAIGLLPFPLPDFLRILEITYTWPAGDLASCLAQLPVTQFQLLGKSFLDWRPYHDLFTSR